MKRDLDLIREILISIEAYEPDSISSQQTISPSDFLGTKSQNYHHIKILVENNFITLAGKPLLSGDFVINGMTMAGHDFLDAVKDPTVWKNTKSRLVGAGGWTLDIVLDAAKEIIKRSLASGL